MKRFFVAVMMCAICAAAAWGQTWTNSRTGTVNGYDYELWSENNQGTTSMTINGDNGTGANARGGTFTCEWRNTLNILFRSGRKWSNTQGSSGQTHKQIGNISIDFAATWNSPDNVKMLGVYGWGFYAPGSIPRQNENGGNVNFSNQIEYYIIKDRGSYNAALGGDTRSTLKGEATIDGILYEFRVCDRLGKHSLQGSSTNFKQYFSVPKNTSAHRTSGIISVSRHFEEWEKVGMLMDGPLYEVALKVESYSTSGASGSASVTKNLLTIGGGVDPNNFTLTTNVVPAAAGTITRSSNPTAGYPRGTQVTLTRPTTAGYVFTGWSGGGCTGTGATCVVTMNANTTVTATYTRSPDAELIANGTFANTQNWTLNEWSGSATFGVSGGNANITAITSASTAENYSIQLVQNGIPLTMGQTYKLTFDASAASARTIGFVVEMDVDPWTSYMTPQTINLTSTRQTFEHTFTMTNPSDENGRVSFNIGGATQNVQISNVSLKQSSGQTKICLKNPIRTATGKSAMQVTAKSSAVSVNFNAVNSGETVLRLYSLKGDVISTAKVKTAAGKSYSHTFNQKNLPNGFYVVKMQNGNVVEQSRVIMPK